MSSLSSRVGRAVRNARFVVEAAAAHRDVVVALVAAEWGQPPEVMGQVFDGATQALSAAASRLQDAETARLQEAEDDDGPRAARDAAAAELADRTREVASLGRMVFPDAKMFELGRLPTDASQLLLAADSLADRLTAADLTGTLELTGGEVTTKALAAKLTATRSALRTALSQVDREAQELTGAIEARDVALRGFQSTYRASALVLEGFFRAADQGRLADQIRPTRRRSAGIEAAESPEAADAPEAAGEADAADSPATTEA